MKASGLRRLGRPMASAVFATLFVLGAMTLAAPAQASIVLEVSDGDGPFIVVDSDLATLGASPVTVSAGASYLIATDLTIQELESTYQYLGDRSLLSTTNVAVTNDAAVAQTFYVRVSAEFDNTGFAFVSAPPGVVDFKFSLASTFFDVGAGLVTTTSSFDPVAAFGTFTTLPLVLATEDEVSTTTTLLGTSFVYNLSQLAEVTVAPGESLQFILTSSLRPNPSGIPVVPEPASMAIWGLGALGLAFAGYRRRKLSRS